MIVLYGLWYKEERAYTICDMKDKHVALLSVYDKTGIVDFARELVVLGWDILASGGTARALAEAGVAARDVSDVVGGEAILGHRVVTLSREIHAALLARDTPEDNTELARLRVPRIDLVCVDLYPLEKEISAPGTTLASVIEKTDIGGPALLRSAAKGKRIVLSDSADRERVIRWLKGGCAEKGKFLGELAAKAEKTVASYCLASAHYHSEGADDGFVGHRTHVCSYGENPRQKPAGLFDAGGDDPLALHQFRLVEGTSPSYNNFCDVDRLLQTVTHIAAAYEKNRGSVPHIAVAVKHGNPCGAAVGDLAKEVLEKTLEGDLRAVFGGVVMTNFPVGEDEAKTLISHRMESEQKRLLDSVIAPSFSAEAISALARKGGKCRLIRNGALASLGERTLDARGRLRYVRGGFLLQPNYTFILDLSHAELEKTGNAARAQEDDMLLAWGIGATSNSNTVTLVQEGQLIGNGVGQQDRVSACELAVKRARDGGHDAKGATAYSDSFFPFPDGPGVLADAGVAAIFASRGSVRDDEVRESLAKRGVIFYTLPDAICRGFFGH
jgi:phosphoribosylaminoimidazolecarboxamide formyltransferase/IMP cyclohydrolase